jgi:hypothetical protein
MHCPNTARGLDPWISRPIERGLAWFFGAIHSSILNRDVFEVGCETQCYEVALTFVAMALAIAR